jgi:hypothetical protein
MDMSRICGFQETTTGHPCENVVEDFEDHCRAGHPCPFSETSVTPGNSDLDASMASLGIDEIFVSSKPVTSKRVMGLRAKAAASWEKAQADTIFAYGVQTEELLQNSVIANPPFEYTDTVDGLTPNGIPYAFQVFMSKDGFRLARGILGHQPHRKHWYAVVQCNGNLDVAHPCEMPAYVRMQQEDAWYGKQRLASAEARTEAFSDDMMDVGIVNALCPLHREGVATSALLNSWAENKIDEEEPVSDTPFDPEDLHAMDEVQLLKTLAGVPESTMPMTVLAGDGLEVVQAFIDAGLAHSQAEAESMIDSGEAYVNDVPIAFNRQTITDLDLLADRYVVLLNARGRPTCSNSTKSHPKVVQGGSLTLYPATALSLLVE